MMRNGSAQGAARPIESTGIGGLDAVADRAPRQTGERKHVYDLEIDGAHEFVANGLLVHNCDSALYAYVGSSAHLQRPKAERRPETEHERIHRETEEAFARDERRRKANKASFDDVFLMTEDDRRDAMDPDTAAEREERWRDNPRIYQ